MRQKLRNHQKRRPVGKIPSARKAQDRRGRVPLTREPAPRRTRQRSRQRGQLARGQVRARPRLVDELKGFTPGEWAQLRSHLADFARWSARRVRLGHGSRVIADLRRRDLLLCDLLASTGLRASEAASLTGADLAHVTDEEPYVILRGGKKRAAGHVASLPVPADLAERLAAEAAELPPDGHLFRWSNGAPLGRRGIWWTVKRVCRAAQLRATLNAHSFRHLFLTALASQPSATPHLVMALGRVRDLKTVQTYFHLGRREKAAAVEALDLTRPRG